MDYKSYVESKFVDNVVRDSKSVLESLQNHSEFDFEVVQDLLSLQESIKMLEEFRESLKKKAQETNPEPKNWWEEIV